MVAITATFVARLCFDCKKSIDAIHRNSLFTWPFLPFSESRQRLTGCWRTHEPRMICGRTFSFLAYAEPAMVERPAIPNPYPYPSPNPNPNLNPYPVSTLQQVDSSKTHIQDNNGLETLTLEETMASFEGLDELPGIEDLIFLLQKCSKLKSPEFARLLHMRMCDNGVNAHRALGNYVVPMLVECRDVYEAQQAFNRFVQWNEHSWTALILGYVECGEFQLAREIFQKMQRDNVNTSSFTFTALLKGCAGLKCVERGQEIHAEVVKEGHETDLYLGTILLDMYVKCGSLAEAHEVFSELPIRDGVSWNALIAGYAEHGPGAEALNLLGKMQTEGIAPDSVTYVCSLKACASIGAVDKGRQLHSEIIKRELESNMFVCTTLVDMYASCGSLVDAREVFDKFQARGVTAWNALIAGYTEHGLGQEALNCLDQMQLQNVSPSDITFVCSLKACSTIGALDRGQKLHDDIAKEGLEGDPLFPSALVDMYAKCGALAEAQEIFDELSVRDVVLWTALIAGYSEHGLSEEALKCLDQMQREGVSPDAVAFVCSLNACGNLGCIDKGKEIHFKITGSGLETTEVTLANALIDMYAKCGSMVDAQQIFDTMPKRDRVTWTSLITGHARQGEIEPVFYLFERMKSEGIRPDEITFLSILTVCSHIGLLDMAQKCFDDMSKKYGISPSIGHHNCMVDLLGRAGQLYEAIMKLEEMPIQADLVAWRTVLGACHKWGDVELGKHAFDYMVKLDENNAAAFILMSNLSVEDVD